MYDMISFRICPIALNIYTIILILYLLYHWMLIYIADWFSQLKISRLFLFQKEVSIMTNEKLNTALYHKMFAEQDKYRTWLLTQPPEEILNHAYEYTTREDILLSLEYNDLPDKQAIALLKSPFPLADVFKDFEKRETDHMSDIWDTVECRANAMIKQDSLKEKAER